MRPKVAAFCGDCHPMPRPSSSPQNEWPGEVDQGFMLYTLSKRNDLEVPDRNDVITFFQAQAPRQLDWSAWSRPRTKSQINFKTQPIGLPTNNTPRIRPPGVTNVNWLDLGIMDSPAVVYCDIGGGAVMAHWPQEAGGVTKQLATLFQPVHVEACDLDEDGFQDLVVADIGEFDANDSQLGRIVWLQRDPESDNFIRRVIKDGLGRVADVRPADLDGDGDEDLIVGEFGWRQSGRIFWLENQLDPAGDALTATEITDGFQVHEIDQRHGTVHVSPCDLNGDGHVDFVALISQGYETVEAFINDGDGQFRSEVIFQAPGPAFGSSGIQLVDMDSDDDLDVLLTNGDSFDRGIKPYHSIQWLENEGRYPYTYHCVSQMPGVLSAKAGDFDGDGDMDIVAGSLMAGPIRDRFKNLPMASISMLLQSDTGEFEEAWLELRTHQHASIVTADVDDNGKLDFVISNLLRKGGENDADAVIWLNQTP